MPGTRIKLFGILAVSAAFILSILSDLIGDFILGCVAFAVVMVGCLCVWFGVNKEDNDDFIPKQGITPRADNPD